MGINTGISGNGINVPNQFDARSKGVNVDTDGLRGLGEKIATSVNGYNEEKTKINTLVDNISSAWSDPANKVFKTKVDSYKDSFDKLGVVMGEFGTFCVKQAAKFENTISNLEDTASSWL